MSNDKLIEILEKLIYLAEKGAMLVVNLDTQVSRETIEEAKKILNELKGQ